MSSTLTEARNKLNILEETKNNPELILTALLDNTSQFLYQIEINGQCLTEYMENLLSKLPVFNKTKITYSCGYLNVSTLISYRKYGSNNDLIMKINVTDCTYRLSNDAINHYSDILNSSYELETCELSDFFKRYEDLTLKKRIIYAFESFSTKKQFHIKVFDFFTNLFISKKYVDNAVRREKEKISVRNEQYLKNYDDNVQLQELYKKEAPTQINLIRSKQKEIATYLKALGYEEEM